MNYGRRNYRDVQPGEETQKGYDNAEWTQFTFLKVTLSLVTYVSVRGHI